MPEDPPRPAPARREERDNLDMPADEAMAAIMDTGPHPEEEWEEDPGAPHSSEPDNSEPDNSEPDNSEPDNSEPDPSCPVTRSPTAS